MKLGAVALLPYFQPGDPAVADAIRELNGKHAAILIARHGPVVAAKPWSDAVFATEELEETANLAQSPCHLPRQSLSDAQFQDLSGHFLMP